MPKTDNNTSAAKNPVSPRKNRSPSERERTPTLDRPGASGDSLSLSCLAAPSELTTPFPGVYFPACLFAGQSF